MPTYDNLQKRGCHLASMCSNCNTHVETSSHLFLTCPFVVKLWDWLGSIFNIHINTSPIDSIFSVCNGQWSPHVKGVLVVAVIHTVNIVWFCRNHKRFENKALNLLQPQSKIKLATSLSGNNSKILTNNSFTFQKAPRIKEVVWISPLVGWIKINSDGAAHGAPGIAGGGSIFRDFKGAYMGGFVAFFGIKDSLFVELQAAIMEIEIAHQKGWKAI
ncbi:hypothetical protein Lal_00032980 [Lupinus albus]|nr:hypothetical protein Lal_00032980 [Lupinus albus]